ncbi:hypothetical protein ACFQ1M_00520 [Sungkyunkwania multivorans]|uniref:Uncharacterized protein n=1 Tax=Sungkyunkwania multivorans TaxID=1173618 RepID=A0ABW3CVQ6_9FLAO
MIINNVDTIGPYALNYSVESGGQKVEGSLQAGQFAQFEPAGAPPYKVTIVGDVPIDSFEVSDANALISYSGDTSPGGGWPPTKKVYIVTNKK